MNTRYTENDYIEKCASLGLNYIGFHKEKKRGTVIDFSCNFHLDKGNQHSDWSHFRKYTIGCVYCTGRKKTNRDIESLIKNKNVQLISEYNGNEKPIQCKCLACSNIWTTLPKVLTTNGSGCPLCGKNKAALSRRKNIEQFKNDLYRINPNIEIVGEYVGAHSKIKCKCRIDGTEWNAIPSNLLNRSAGCPTCNTSVGEKTLLQTLDFLNVDYVTQYSIEKCKNVKPLKFDAYDIKNNVAFEYNGEQHYQPVDFAGKGFEWAENEFKTTVLRDSIKKDFCQCNNIPLIIVPYWERDNMINYVEGELRKIKYGGT